MHHPRLHIETRGSGPDILFCHAFAGSARNFRPLARALEGRYRVTCFDMRGHARSEAPNTPGSYRAECFVADVRRVMREVGIERALLGGLSMGAAVVLDFARTHPAHVAGLFLSSFPAADTREWALAFARDVDALGPKEAGARWVWGSESRFGQAAGKTIERGFLEHPAHAMASILREFLAEQPRPEELAASFGDAPVPTLVVAGELDPASVASSRALASAWPNAELEIIPGGGHVLNFSAAERFTELVVAVAERAFVRAHAARPPDAG
jgi:pimeloyl-ACP methyl ester carboxylesterase